MNGWDGTRQACLSWFIREGGEFGLSSTTAHLAIAGGRHSPGEIDSLLPGQLTWLRVPFPLPAIAFVA
jgi:hypothetical protein